MQSIKQLLYLQGIGNQYTSYNGDQITISDDVRRSVLAVCGYDLEDLDAVNLANFQLDVAPWFDIIAKTSFVSNSDFILKVHANAAQVKSQICWKIYKNNQLVNSNCKGLAQLKEVGNYQYNDQVFREFALKIDDIAIGYYQIEISINDITHSGELVVYPNKAYLNDYNQAWGVSLQLYSLIGDNNYGIGDFNDLKSVIQHSSQRGADYILLNPLHALFDHEPNRASPYSPSDRLCINPLYIHIQDIEDFNNCADAQALAKSDLLSTQLKQQKSESYIDYELVFSLKYQIYYILFQYFLEHHKLIKSHYYKQFINYKNGNDISSYCDWVCAQENLKANYKDPEFIAYLQWQANIQFEQCQQLSKQSNMRLGLIRDLAVGCAQDGNEFKQNENIFIKNASIGAPPDPWSNEGQNWGLPPIEPIKLKQSGYSHYIKLLQSNLKSCGALRIDHVMALLRLWWCILDNSEQNKGCYVYYPFEQMLALLKLESHLNQCEVIGEDLGIVPDEIKSALKSSNIYSNLLFYFEKNHIGEFIAPDEFEPHAMLMVANHDVPTFKAWWQKSDINLRHSLNLYPSADKCLEALAQRQSEKTKLLNWLNLYKSQSDVKELTLDSSHQHIYLSLLIILARTKVKLLTVQLDDLDDNELPVNIPGTDKEYPNWRRRLHNKPKKLFSENTFFKQLNQARKHYE